MPQAEEQRKLKEQQEEELRKVRTCVFPGGVFVRGANGIYRFRQHERRRATGVQASGFASTEKRSDGVRGEVEQEWAAERAGCNSDCGHAPAH